MQLPKNFPIPVAICLAMNIQVWSATHRIKKLRKKIFNLDYMQKYFGKQHQQQLKENIQVGGFPDVGSGLYSQKLSYRDYYHFNVLQRIYMHGVENICLASTSVLAAGLYKPIPAAIIGSTYLLGRILFTIGYQKQRGAWNNMKILGVSLLRLSIIANFGIFTYYFCYFIKELIQDNQ